MFSSSQELTGNTGSIGGGDLESRLRGLILNNASPVPNPAPISAQEGIQGIVTGNSIGAAPTAQLPPHMLSAPPAEQQAYLVNSNLRQTQNLEKQNIQSGQHARKRPNQAQRRQMNSSLSISIDPKPDQTANHGLPFGRSPGHGPSHWPNQPHNGQPQIQQNQQWHKQHQSYSPRFQHHGPPTPYPARPFLSQNSQQSPMYLHQSGNSQNLPRQGSNQYPQYQPGPFSPRPPPQGRQLYQPGPYHGQGRGANFVQNTEELVTQSLHLEFLVQKCIPTVGIDSEEEAEKERFRTVVESACREAIAKLEQFELGDQMFDALSVQLQCFGSMRSGFATKASDMDLALLSPKSKLTPDSPNSPIPRLLEKVLLDRGFGARLLTRTRVPIIKLCQKPTEKLRADLLEERAKWESGFVEDTQDEQGSNGAGAGEATTAINTEHTDGELSPTQEKPPSAPASEPYEEKLACLKQKEQQSLGDYTNCAKRLLRKLGGRDITAGCSNLTQEEGKILSDTCKAYISGLSSEALILRLQGYQSISPMFENSNPSIQRTLQSISLQVEGERLAMAWDERPLCEDNDKREFECMGVVEAWRALQNKQSLTTTEDSLKYNRDLYIATEKLKKISSLQLVFLEQGQHEEPIYYYGRAQKLLEDLTGRARGSADTVNPIVSAHYIAGISNLAIRETLQNLVHKDAPLQRLSIQHRILQLAEDYEHALTTKMYDDTDRPIIEKYIIVLRSLNVTDSMTRIGPAIGRNLHTELVAKIRSLPEPSTVSLTKPRDRYKDHLEFPKTDIGIQCDINFAAHLAIHNTLLLRCYSHCDPRVKLMILFIKHWAKIRGINTPYRGSLSSYGYVLMVLHYLVNVAQPFVCPNLQTSSKDPPQHLSPEDIEARSVCNGRDIRFWRNEAEIKDLAERKMLNHNHDSIGLLLRGFFEYFAQNGPMTTLNHRAFDWGRDVLSLRTQAGILSKQEKGWVGAKTTIETTIVAPPTPFTSKAPESPPNINVKATENPEVKAISLGEEAPKNTKPSIKIVEETKEIRHRYLFAIEDPFELDHNVARTVTHSGIVSIREEFRRAWRIIRNISKPEQRDGGLLDQLDTSDSSAQGGWHELLYLIHGPIEQPSRGNSD